MSGLTLFFTLFAYLAFAIFVVGFMSRICTYAIAANPLKIALTPAPTTSSGVVLRMAQEVGLLKSRFSINKIIWLAGYIFRVGLAVVLIKRLRFFSPTTPAAITYITTFEAYVGFIMLLPLLLFLILRLVVDRVFYIGNAGLAAFRSAQGDRNNGNSHKRMSNAGPGLYPGLADAAAVAG